MTNQIQEIRLLPMDNQEEFKTEADVRKFLSMDLIEKDGKYYYRKQKIRVQNKYALILFQYNASIIGYGILKDLQKQGCTDTIEGKIIQYNGYLQFFTMTIHNVDNITLSEITKITKNIQKFSQSKQFIEIEHYREVYLLLLKKQAEFERNRGL